MACNSSYDISMIVDERHLRTIHAVIRHGGVRAASEHLNVDPSVVSRTVAQAERLLGIAIFERQGKTLLPTAAAYTLFEYHQQQTLHQADLQTALDDIRGLRSGTVRVVAGEGFVDGLVCGPLRAFQSRYPKVFIELRTMSVDEIASSIINEGVELGVAHNPVPRDGVVSIASAPMPIRLVTAPTHHLVQRGGPVSLTELLTERLALTLPGFGLRRAIEVVEFIERTKAHPVMETNSIASLRSFVVAGLGSTVLPTIAVHAELEAAKVALLPIAHEVFESAEAKLLVRKGRRLSPAASELSQLMSAHIVGLARFA